MHVVCRAEGPGAAASVGRCPAGWSRKTAYNRQWPACSGPLPTRSPLLVRPPMCGLWARSASRLVRVAAAARRFLPFARGPAILTHSTIVYLASARLCIWSSAGARLSRCDHLGFGRHASTFAYAAPLSSQRHLAVAGLALPERSGSAAPTRARLQALISYSC
jgi:hypothetical protein